METGQPLDFFGRERYFAGHNLEDPGYRYLDALKIAHEPTGIQMWACAMDVREGTGHFGLRPGDRVIYHYTDKDSFLKITSLEDPKVLARMDELRDSCFGFGVYATEKAPHQWESKDAVRLNNYYPTAENFRSWSQIELPALPILMTSWEGLLGAMSTRITQARQTTAIIVDQQVSKNAMEEVTDGPLMPNREKRLAGYNSLGERQPPWRNVWVVSIYNQTISNPRHWNRGERRHAVIFWYRWGLGKAPAEGSKRPDLGQIWAWAGWLPTHPKEAVAQRHWT